MNLRDRLRMLKAAGTERARAQAGAEPRAAEPEELFSPPIGGGRRISDEAPEPARAGGRDGDVRGGTVDGGASGLPGTGATTAFVGGCIDGFVTGTEAGEAFYVETRYPVEYCRGPLSLEHCHTIPGSAWTLLGRVPDTVDLRRAVFFDTETTGLAGGTGTHAFLVGLGHFEGYDFVVRQYFLRDYPEEDAMLEAVDRDLRRFEAIVSFNGKSFDWPLMETRFRLARRRVPLSGAPHLDLLHPSRRIWRDRLVQCNLTNLEAQVLGVHRQGDVPGALIPQLYFDYLRTGEAGPLADVILHNRLDIVSLVSLAGWLGQMVTAPFTPTPDGELICGDDLYALGRLFEARGEHSRAIACYETSLERGLEAISPALAQRSLSQAYKRLREHDRAVAIWSEMIEGEGALSLFPFIEMAKYYEHVARDLDRAREMARQALAIAERRRSLSGTYGPAAAKDLEAVRHRLGRLERKLGGGL
jgi:uncharacterized protein YprB with RNaseH-like and TPR domain